MKATVLADASYDHSHRLKPAGWAAWVRVDGLERPVTGYGIITKPCASSTVAEVYAALNGVWLASRHGGKDILVRSDCMTVRHLILGQVKSTELLKIWNDAMALDWAQGLSISSRHIKGHKLTGEKAAWVNDWCDQKAKLAMRRARIGKQCMVLSGGQYGAA